MVCIGVVARLAEPALDPALVQGAAQPRVRAQPPDRTALVGIQLLAADLAEAVEQRPGRSADGSASACRA